MLDQRVQWFRTVPGTRWQYHAVKMRVICYLNKITYCINYDKKALWFCKMIIWVTKADLPGLVLPLRYPITLCTVLKDAWFSMVRFMIFLAEEQTKIPN